MCGIFGWSFKKNPTTLPILAAVLSAENDGRGGHSWGWYAPLSDTLCRGTGELSHNVAPEHLSKHALLFAHTRYATAGAITMANAHPFRKGAIIGAHNGVVYNHFDLDFDHGECEVDSEHIFAALASKRPLSTIEAYGAVEYVDLARPDRIYLARFNAGVLSCVRVKGGLVWSSESSHLRRAVELASLRVLGTFDLEDGALSFASHGRLYAAGAFPISPPRTTKAPWYARPAARSLPERSAGDGECLSCGDLLPLDADGLCRPCARVFTDDVGSAF